MNLLKLLILLILISCERPQEATHIDLPSSENYGEYNPAIGELSERVQRGDIVGAGEYLNGSILRGPSSDCRNNMPDRNYEPRRARTDREVHINLESFPPPKKRGRSLNLWATNYYTLIVQNKGEQNSRHPLYNHLDIPISHKGEVSKLSKRRWCSAGIEGSVRIAYKNGDIIAYNYHRTGRQIRVGRKRRAYEVVKFRKAKSKYGEGVKSMGLVPFRTIAVDPKNIPYGTVLFIPSAVGKVVTLANGQTFKHDGYFYAADTGGAIKGNHIDVFTGGSRSTQSLDFIKSTSRGTFKAQLVKDKSIIQKMRAMHSKRY